MYVFTYLHSKHLLRANVLAEQAFVKSKCTCRASILWMYSNEYIQMTKWEENIFIWKV